MAWRSLSSVVLVTDRCFLFFLSSVSTAHAPMRVHSHTSLPLQLAILRCHSYLSVLYFPFILFSVTCVPSRVDVFSVSSFRSRSIRYLFAFALPLRAPLVRSLCALRKVSIHLSLSRTHACVLSYLSVCTSTLSLVIVLSPPFSSVPCVRYASHTLDTRCRCHRSVVDS